MKTLKKLIREAIADDRDNQMASHNLNIVIEKAKNILEHLSNGTKMESWMEDKISKASDDIQEVCNKMMFSGDVIKEEDNLEGLYFKYEDDDVKITIGDTFEISDKEANKQYYVPKKVVSEYIRNIRKEIYDIEVEDGIKLTVDNQRPTIEKEGSFYVDLTNPDRYREYKEALIKFVKNNSEA